MFDKPLMASRQAMVADLPKWFGDDISKLNVIVGLDLSYNGSVLAKEGTCWGNRRTLRRYMKRTVSYKEVFINFSQIKTQFLL